MGSDNGAIMNIINSMRLRNRKGSKLKGKTPPSSKIRVSLLQMQATERDLMDLSTIMIKAVRCFELGLECKNQDRSKYIHYLKVASAYMKNTVPLMKKMGLISGIEIGTGDVRNILSIRNILQGLRPDDSDAVDSPYLPLLAHLVEHSPELGADFQNDISGWLFAYMMLLQNFDASIRNAVFAGSLKNQAKYALPEEYVSALYRLLDTLPDIERVPFSRPDPRRHPRPGVLRVKGTVILIEGKL